MKLTDRIYVAGHRGLVGSAVTRELERRGYNVWKRTRQELDLLDPVAVQWFFSSCSFDYVFLCAAKAAGIKAHIEDPVAFYWQNIQIQNNVLMNAAKYGVKKLVFLGSNCIYPRDCPQPIREEYLLTGPIEKTTEPYALAKIAGVRLCQWLKATRYCNFVSAMPCNIFGPNDTFDPDTGHIVSGIIARMDRAIETGAKEFKVWGDGSAMREFLYSDDLAQALVLIMEKYEENEPINTGSGFELRVDTLTRTIARAMGFCGEIICDPSQPVGTPRKIMENSKIQALGWYPKVEFYDAICQTIDAFKQSQK